MSSQSPTTPSTVSMTELSAELLAKYHNNASRLHSRYLTTVESTPSVIKVARPSIKVTKNKNTKYSDEFRKNAYSQWMDHNDDDDENNN